MSKRRENDGITLSEKHGVNPTLIKCFWCREEAVGVALLGKLKNDDAAPPYIYDTSYKPCKKCQEIMNKGIHLVSVRHSPMIENQPPISDKLYPDGMWTVASREYVEDLLKSSNQENMIDSVMQGGVLLLEAPMVEEIIQIVQELKEDN